MEKITQLIPLLDKELKLENFTNKVAEDLLRKIMVFKIELLQKNNDFMMFISSNLTGVYNAVFSQLDSERYFSLFGVSEKKLMVKTNDLPDITPEWKVSSNPLYLINIYLIHKYSTSNYPRKEEAIMILFEIMSYKILTSILYQFYKTKLTVDEAKAVFEKLTFKFLIKKLGSWDSVVKYKAELVLKDGTYYDSIMKLSTLDAVLTINAIQTSYKSLIKYIANISHSGTKDKISSSSIVEMTSEGKLIKDMVNSSVYVNYINGIVKFENDFINSGLIKIVISKIKNVDFDNVKNTLQYISRNEADTKYIEKIIEYSLEYLNSRGESFSGGNLNYITSLKGFWSSGNNNLKDIKNKIKETSFKATGRKTDWILNATTITVICYIFTRAVTKNNI